MAKPFQYDLGMCACVRASNARDILRAEVNMFDNLRDSAESSFYEEEQNDAYHNEIDDGVDKIADLDLAEHHR